MLGRWHVVYYKLCAVGKWGRRRRVVRGRDQVLTPEGAYGLYECMLGLMLYSLLMLVMAVTFRSVMSVYQSIQRSREIQHNARVVQLRLNASLKKWARAYYTTWPAGQVEVAVLEVGKASGLYSDELSVRYGPHISDVRRYYIGRSHHRARSVKEVIEGLYVDEPGGAPSQEWVMGVTQLRVLCSWVGKDELQHCPREFARDKQERSVLSGLWIEIVQCDESRRGKGDVIANNDAHHCVHWQQFVCLRRACLRANQFRVHQTVAASIVLPMLYWVILLSGLLLSLLQMVSLNLIESHEFSLFRWFIL